MYSVCVCTNFKLKKKDLRLILYFIFIFIHLFYVSPEFFVNFFLFKFGVIFLYGKRRVIVCFCRTIFGGSVA